MVKTNRSTLHTVYNIHRFRSNCNYVALRVCFICRIYTAPFLNASDSERPGAENLDKIRHFLTPVKSREG